MIPIEELCIRGIMSNGREKEYLEEILSIIVSKERIAFLNNHVWALTSEEFKKQEAKILGGRKTNEM